nr:metallophosphoesterase [Paraburkholderia sacchari]
MKIAALSDIHGNLAALNVVLDDIQRQGADVIVNLTVLRTTDCVI